MKESSPARHNFFETEDCKSILHQNQPRPLQTYVGGNPVTIELGTGTDLDLIAEATKRFADAVWKKVAAFAAGETPSHVYVTGGGSRVKNVTDTLRAAIIDPGRMRVVSVNDGEGASGAESQRAWRQTGEGLQRLATAVGGASVILQEAAAPVQRDRAGLQECLVEPPAGYKTCRCQGGNKDCSFCGGWGFLPNR